EKKMSRGACCEPDWPANLSERRSTKRERFGEYLLAWAYESGASAPPTVRTALPFSALTCVAVIVGFLSAQYKRVTAAARVQRRTARALSARSPEGCQIPAHQAAAR